MSRSGRETKLIAFYEGDVISRLIIRDGKNRLTVAQVNFMNLCVAHPILEKSPRTAISIALALGFAVKFVPYKNCVKEATARISKVTCCKCKGEFEEWTKWAKHECHAVVGGR